MRFILSSAFVAAALAVPSLAHAQSVTYGPGTGGVIVSNDAAGITSTITVSDFGVIAANELVSVTVNGLSHTFLGDLIITLSHSGTTVDIIDRIASNDGIFLTDSSNVNGDYTFVSAGGADFSAVAMSGNTNFVVPAGIYNTVPVGATTVANSAADGSLTGFQGLNRAGDWTLTISDRAGTTGGSFTGWQFTVSAAAAPEPGSLALLAVGLLALRRRRK